MTPAQITLTPAETIEVLSALLDLAMRLRRDRAALEAAGVPRQARAILEAESQVIALAEELRQRSQNDQ